MPASPIQKAKWVFIMNNEIDPNSNISDRQNANARADQGKHVFINDYVNPTQAYNLMLDTYGRCCWSDMLSNDIHAQMYSVDVLDQQQVKELSLAN